MREGVSPLTQPSPATRSARAATAWADDVFVDGMARARAVNVQAPQEAWPDAAAGGERDAEWLVVSGAEPEAGLRSLAQFDRGWLAPALAQWQQGRVGTATLLAGERAITLPALGRWRRRWRGLRKSRPWWEILLR